MSNIELSYNELKEISLLIKNESGFIIEEKRYKILNSKVKKRMEIVKAKSPADYIYKLIRVNEVNTESEISLLTACILNHHTFFFRDRDQINCFAEYCIPEIIAYKSRLHYDQIKIWSAACSTGEEPYSLSIVLNTILKPPWTYQIDATDIDQPSLNFAQKGIYSDKIKSNIPANYIERFFEKKAGAYKVKPEIQKNITFTMLNLVENKSIQEMKHYDTIFCNNVLFYFDEPTQSKIILQLCDALRPGGFIFFTGQVSIRHKSRLIMRKIGNSIAYQKGSPDIPKELIIPIHNDSLYQSLPKNNNRSNNQKTLPLPVLNTASSYPFDSIYNDRQLASQDFIDIKAIINKYSGLYLTKKDHDNIKKNVRFRMLENRLREKEDYFKLLIDQSNYELKELTDLIMNYDTDFFMDYDQLICIAEVCIPLILSQQKWKKSRHIETWCIGCSTGEEAYTISIILSEILSETPECSSHILATDRTERVLNAASKGVYKKGLVYNVPAIYLKEYFTLISEGYSLNLDIRKRITFECQNLLQRILNPSYNIYEFIFCRNVLAMFDRQTQIKVLDGLYKYLKPGGFFIIEADFPYDVISDKYPFEFFGDGIYQK